MTHTWIVGNWKLNPANKQQATALTQDILHLHSNRLIDATKTQLVLAPSFIHLDAVQQQLTQPHADWVQLAAQDVCSQTATTGAFTGDISASQLQAMGVNWVLVGHSERRDFYQENAQLLKQKISMANQAGLGIIFCIGETKTQREQGQAEQIISQQLQQVFVPLLEKNTPLNSTNLIVAYEPIWAIGSGLIPSLDDVAHMHAHIHQTLENLCSSWCNLAVLYGGSVKPENAAQFAACAGVNGVLVGGASLNAQNFLDIAQSFG